MALTEGDAAMSDPIAPSAARTPAEVAKLVSVAVSDGDLEAAAAQYEVQATLQPWAAPAEAGERTVRHWLAQLMELRLPVAVRVCSVLTAGDIALVLGERKITGTGPDCQPVNLHGAGATVVRRQPGGEWRIAADAWRLADPDRAGTGTDGTGPGGTGTDGAGAGPS